MELAAAKGRRNAVGKENPVTQFAGTPDAQGQVDAIVADLRARAAELREQQASALSTSGSASSQDGAVRVVVDATGVVTALELNPSVFDRTTPEKLARTLVATVQAAARDARGQVSAAWDSIRAPHSGVLAAAAKGTQRIGLSAVSIPEVPSTEFDPTGDQDEWHGPAEPAPRNEQPDSYQADERPW